jgi:glutamate N-acetyltransferase/amino-acid N-acetyltransferase
MTASADLIAEGTITTPRGFLAGATYAGVKRAGEGALDLGLLYSERPCTAAGVFTTNRIKAAPVVLTRRHLENARAQAIVVNSGCANACTGEDGLADAESMAEVAATSLGLSPEDVLVASTGVIGPRLPMTRIGEGISRISLSREGGHALAKAITTTDTLPKEVSARVALGPDGPEIGIGGIAKGSGMIHPELATMLCFLATDAAVEPGFLKQALTRAADASFNMMTVDGDTSPNDSAIILANGASGSSRIEAGRPGAEEFQQVLEGVCISLARLLAMDGEGATKLIEVTVDGAATAADARRGARTVAGSFLVKAAVHGSDPNWGRIIAAMGRSGVEIVESKTDLYLDSICLMREGRPVPFDQQGARAVLDRAEVPIRVCLNLGSGRAIAWGCDLSEEYVTINSEYTT